MDRLCGLVHEQLVALPVVLEDLCDENRVKRSDASVVRRFLAEGLFPVRGDRDVFTRRFSRVSADLQWRLATCSLLACTQLGLGEF